MRNKLIHLLGGFTSEEFKSLQWCENSWRDRALNAEYQVISLSKNFEDEKQERKHLQEMLLARAGLIVHDAGQVSPPNENPIRTSRPSFMEQKRAFERAEHKKLIQDLNREVNNAI